MAFDKKQLAECLAREIQKRRDNYPRWVREGKMKQSVADEQIDMMQVAYRVVMRASDELIKEAQPHG